MSNERAMKNWPLIRTHLQNSPMMKPKQLQEKLRGQISRSDMYDFLNVYHRKKLILRPSGNIMLVKKPSFWEPFFSVLKSGFGFFDWVEKKEERERRWLKEDIRDLDKERDNLRKEMCSDED